MTPTLRIAISSYLFVGGHSLWFCLLYFIRKSVKVGGEIVIDTKRNVKYCVKYYQTTSCDTDLLNSVAKSDGKLAAVKMAQRRNKPDS